MPMDDEPDEFGFQPPLPPEDRLWRHPSELGAAAVGQSITIVNRPKLSGRTWLIAAMSCVVGVAGTLLALDLAGAFDDRPQATAVEQVQIPVPKDPAASDLAVAEQVLPAVARVDVSGQGGSHGGTAIVIRNDGVLLTSADAVDGAQTVDVTFNDGQQVEGRLLGLDRDNDLAVVKVDRQDLPTITIGHADSLELGERTVVVSAVLGHPEGPIVGVGLVSGLGERVMESSGGWLHGMIRANVSVAPDTTGAPLVDSSGSVVGLVTRRGAPTTGDDVGTPGQRLEVRFATPIDWAKRVCDEIVFTGRVHGVWLGVEGNDLDAKQTDQLGRGGAAVVRVADGSPAAQAGIAPGDVITAVDDQSVSTMSDLVVALRAHLPGDVVQVSYLHDSEPQVALATLVEKTASP